MNRLQCPKYLWLLFNDRTAVPEPDASTQHIFDQGHVIGVEYNAQITSHG